MFILIPTVFNSLSRRVVSALAFGFVIVSAPMVRADITASTVFIVCKNKETGVEQEGSGVVISEAGHVLTAKHLLVGPPEQNECLADFGTASVRPERFIERREVVDGYDVAVFKFSPRTGEVFVPIDYAPLDKTMEGQTALVAGFPAGRSQTTITFPAFIGSIALSGAGNFVTNGMLSPGMSGGPVVLDDKLIGLVSGSTFSDTTGVVQSGDILAIEPFYDRVKQYFDGEARHKQDLLVLLDELLSSPDACTELFRQSVAYRYPEFAQADVQVSSELNDIATYWVTITTGPAQWLNCESEKIAKSVYFPIGLIVRPVTEITLEGEAEPRTVYQTEHGLRVLIDRSAVAPVTANDGYIFADGNAVYNLCTRNDATCDPGEEFRLSTTSSAPWPFLTGFQSYLHVEDGSSLDAVKREFEGFKAYQVNLNKKLVNPDDPLIRHRNPATLADDPACEVREAMLFRFHKAPDPDAFQGNSEYLTPVNYSLCSVGPDGKVRFRRVKLVTSESAAAKFEHLWSAYTMKRPSREMFEVVNALANTNLLRFDPFVDCGEERKLNLMDLALAPLNTGGVIEMAEVVSETLENANAPLRQYYIRPYLASPGLSKTTMFATAPLFHAIELLVSCDENLVPQRVETVTINFPPVFSQKIVLSVADLNAEYTEMGSKGWGTPAERRLNFGAGVIDRICEYTVYVDWRQVLFDTLKVYPTIIEGAQALEVSPDQMADHFTHLLMASVFSTNVNLRTAETPYEGCD